MRRETDTVRHATFDRLRRQVMSNEEAGRLADSLDSLIAQANAEDWWELDETIERLRQIQQGEA